MELSSIYVPITSVTAHLHFACYTTLAFASPGDSRPGHTPEWQSMRTCIARYVHSTLYQEELAVLTAGTARNERCVSSRYIKQYPHHRRTTRLTPPPGAAVLAHSLRDCGTSKKLAVLVTPDTLRPSTIDELRVSSTKNNRIAALSTDPCTPRTSTTMSYRSSDSLRPIRRTSTS